MDVLIAFLKARLDEDEAAARAILEDPDYAAEWHEQSSGVLYVGPGSEQHPLDGLQPLGDSTLTRFIARHDPARVLREVEADRKLLAAWQNAERNRPHDDAEYAHGHADGLADGLLLAVKIRAGRFSGHPDYRAEWKP